LDYTQNFSNSIDSRVLQVCTEAENNYIENQNRIREIKQMKSFEKINNLLGFNSQEHEIRYFDENYNHKNFQKDLDNQNAVLARERDRNLNGITRNMKENFSNSSKMDQFAGKNSEADKSNFKIPFKHNHSKSGKKCIACELKRK
jgi:hypothetical protein